MKRVRTIQGGVYVDYYPVDGPVYLDLDVDEDDDQ